MQKDYDLQSSKDSDLGSKQPSIGSTIEYLKGYYYIQDLSSCIAVEELEIHDGSGFGCIRYGCGTWGQDDTYRSKTK